MLKVMVIVGVGATLISLVVELVRFIRAVGQAASPAG